jgi:hypothetical protein
VRRAATLLELMVAALIFTIVGATVWRSFGVGSKQTADGEALTELLRAESVLDAILGADLDRLVVEPGCRPAGLSESGRRLAFYVTRDTGAGPGEIAVDPVVYRVEPARGRFVLRRNGDEVAGVTLAGGRFDVTAHGPRWLVSARLTIVGSEAGWRGGPSPGGRYDVCRAYGSRPPLPALASWIRPTAAIPGEPGAP